VQFLLGEFYIFDFYIKILRLFDALLVPIARLKVREGEQKRQGSTAYRIGKRR
jgi:hypothetical protein